MHVIKILTTKVGTTEENGKFYFRNLFDIHVSLVYFENIKLCIIYSVGYWGLERRDHTLPTTKEL